LASPQLPTEPYTIIEVATAPNWDGVAEQFVRVIDEEFDPAIDRGEPFEWLGLQDGMHVPATAIELQHGWRVIARPVPREETA
jgi:hypothetical protein